MNHVTHHTPKNIVEKSFTDTSFDAKGYLREYYSSIDQENDELLKFYVEAYKDIGINAKILEFSGGPTIYALIASAAKVKEIHFCDYVPGNLKEVQLWRDAHMDAFDWNIFIKRVLEHEGNKKVTHEAIEERAMVLRNKLTTFLYCDAFSAKPLGYIPDRLYDIVQTNFVAESITSSKKHWSEIIQNIASLITPNGTLLISAIKNSSYYHLDKKRFPAVRVYEEDLVKILKTLGFTNHAIVRSIPANPPYRGYDGFIFIKAKRNH